MPVIPPADSAAWDTLEDLSKALDAIHHQEGPTAHTADEALFVLDRLEAMARLARRTVEASR